MNTLIEKLDQAGPVRDSPQLYCRRLKSEVFSFPYEQHRGGSQKVDYSPHKHLTLLLARQKFFEPQTSQISAYFIGLVIVIWVWGSYVLKIL